MIPGDQLPPDYPARWEGEVVLRDGGTVHIRPVRCDDVGKVEAFHARQSREAIYFRYFTPMARLTDRELNRLVTVDYLTHMSFVVLLGDEIIGMAGYDIWANTDMVEAAFIVDEAHRGRGIATLLLEYLVVAARENGFAWLTARVLPDNIRMLSVFNNAGFEISSGFEDGAIEVRLALGNTDVSTEAVDERQRRAEVISVGRLLDPASVAVIGVGRSADSYGNAVFRNIMDAGFPGIVYPVNHHGGRVGGVDVFVSVDEIPAGVDMAVVAVPAMEVADVVKACAAKRVGSLVILSEDLDRLEIDGRSASAAVVERALRSGMRVIGPGSMGLINNAPDVALHATFSNVTLGAGNVAFVTESGAMGVAILDHARTVGMGISAFVDIGDRVDVSGNDLLQYWEEDEATSIVLMYMQSLGNPRKFTRIARRMARVKPIVAVMSYRDPPPVPMRSKDNRSAMAGVWPPDATMRALLDQSGVIRVDTPTEMFDVAKVLASQPLPAGRNVAVISNSRGASALTMHACIGAGLEPASRTCTTPDPPDDQGGSERVAGSSTEPVCLRWDAGPEAFATALEAALADDALDAVIVVYVLVSGTSWREVAEALEEVAQRLPTKPVVASLMGVPTGADLDARSVLGTIGSRIPHFTFPDEAARALGRVMDHVDWLGAPEGTIADASNLDLEQARGFVRDVLDSNPDGCWLDRDGAGTLMRHIGFKVAEHAVSADSRQVARAGARIGYPVVLKADSSTPWQGGELGGIALDLHDEPALLAAYERMAGALGESMDVAVVQEMVPAGVDVLVTAHRHVSFGAIVSIGAGGAMTSINRDLGVQVLPMSDAAASRLVDGSPVSTLLWQRDPSGSSVEAAEELLVHLGAALEAIPEIVDVVLNPLIIGLSGAWITDAIIRVAPLWAERPPPVRRLA